MNTYQALKQHAAALTTQSADQYVQVQDPSGNVVMRNKGYYSLDDSEAMGQVTASTSVASSLGGTQVDFKIEPSAIDGLNFPVLRAVFLNSSGANASRNSLHSEVNRLDVLNAKGDVLWSTTGQEMFFANTLFSDRNAFIDCCAKLGLTSAFAQLNTVVADAATQTLLLPIYGFFLGCKLFIEALSGPLILRFYFNASTFTVVTGAQMSCQSLSLVLMGKNMKALTKKKLEEVWHKDYIPLSLSHFSVDRIQVSQALAASTRYSISLQGFTGVCGLIVLSIRLAITANTTAQYTYITMDTVDLLDGSNTSLIGSYPRPEDIRILHHANKYRNASCNLGLDVINFCKDPIGSFSLGVVSGYKLITGQETIGIYNSINIVIGHLLD